MTNTAAQPRIISMETRVLKGLSASMSLTNDETFNLWSRFQQMRIHHQLQEPDFYYSVHVYPENYFEAFSPEQHFTKYALIDLNNSELAPQAWEPFELNGGLYAVFDHKGPDTSIFQYIYTQWLPQSGFRLDSRPHFEKLPAGYVPGHPESEEEIYIPILAV